MLFSMYSSPTSIHFGSFVFPLQTILQRYRFTSEIKAALVLYLLPVSRFSVLETKSQGHGPMLSGGWDDNCHLKDLICSTVDEAV